MGKQNVGNKAMEYQPAIKKEKVAILRFGRTLKIKLSERSQAQKITCYMIPFLSKQRMEKSRETKSRLMISVTGKGEDESCC